MLGPSLSLKRLSSLVFRTSYFGSLFRQDFKTQYHEKYWTSKAYHESTGRTEEQWNRHWYIKYILVWIFLQPSEVNFDGYNWYSHTLALCTSLESIYSRWNAGCYFRVFWNLKDNFQKVFIRFLAHSGLLQILLMLGLLLSFQVFYILTLTFRYPLTTAWNRDSLLIKHLPPFATWKAPGARAQRESSLWRTYRVWLLDRGQGRWNVQGKGRMIEYLQGKEGSWWEMFETDNAPHYDSTLFKFDFALFFLLLQKFPT